MADAILDQVHVSNMFNMEGVVAVVTGGGSVSSPSWSFVHALILLLGDRIDDDLYAHLKWRDGVHHRSWSGGSRQVSHGPQRPFLSG